MSQQTTPTPLLKKKDTGDFSSSSLPSPSNKFAGKKSLKLALNNLA